jgi:hypothetical protein
LGLNHTTFWRHFPDVVRELVEQARRPVDPAAEPPSHYEAL